MRNTYKERKVYLEASTDISVNDESNTTYNFGYRYLEAIYDELKINEFFKAQDNKTTYDLESIFKYDTLMRILCPGSKRSTIQLKDSLYSGNLNFQLHHNYRVLSHYSKYQDSLLRHLNERVKKLICRNDQLAFYDRTNYYCEIDFSDKNGLRKKGVSKEHRTEPIIQFELFADSNGIPISMTVFPGNTSDSITLKPCMAEIKKNYNLNRIIVVGDKAFNTKANIEKIINNKVLLFYKKELADLEKDKRTEKIERLIKGLKNGTMKMPKGLEQYIKKDHIVSSTGEVADQEIIETDDKAFEEEAKLDGFGCITTSEIEFDYLKLFEIYSQLWMIEDSFKITKSDFEVRPIYVSVEEHIKGYFVETFVALLIIRLLQFKMGEK